MKSETKRGLLHLFEVVLVTAMLLAVVVGAEESTEVREAAREAEVKANLHSIQLSLEHSAVDGSGVYEQYLIGGEVRYASTVASSVSAGPHFSDFREIEPVEFVSDPLLRKGYLDSYPANPFVTDGLALQQLQADLPFGVTRSDPLRNGTETGSRLGTRFGAECTVMGNVMADPRYAMWDYVNFLTGNQHEEHTYANIEYPCWDVEADDEPRLFLPGMFFYKSAGQLESPAGSTAASKPTLPLEIDQYILGVYGSLHTKGKDVIGTERPILVGPGSAGADDETAIDELWPWTRSVVRPDPRVREGSPYSPHEGDGPYQLDYGNPNGIRDGVVLVLTAGEG